MLNDPRSVPRPPREIEEQTLAKKVKVWDLPTRLFHWTLVPGVIALWVSGQMGKLDCHMIVGALLIGLILFRLAWGLFGSETALFRNFVPGPRKLLGFLKTGAAHSSIGHNPLGALSVLALLGLCLVQALSGLFTSDDIISEGPLAKLVSGSVVSLLSTVHRTGSTVLLVLIGLHLCAILFYTFVKKDSLLKPMITGAKSVPAEVKGISFVNPVWALPLLVVSLAVAWPLIRSGKEMFWWIPLALWGAALLVGMVVKTEKKRLVLVGGLAGVSVILAGVL